MELSKEEEVRNEELAAVAEQERPPTERELRIAAFLARDEEEEAERNREHRLNILSKIRGRLDPELQRTAEAVEKERKRLQDQKQTPWQNVESLLLKKQSCVSGGVTVAVRAIKPTNANQRGKLRAQLRSKTIQSGTRWLAKELGYKNEDEYLHNLKVNEIERKENALKKLQMERQRQIEFSPPSSPSPSDSPASPARSSSSASSSSALSPQLEPAQSPERLADQRDAAENEDATEPSDGEETENDAADEAHDDDAPEVAVDEDEEEEDEEERQQRQVIDNASSTESDHSSEDDDDQDGEDEEEADAHKPVSNNAPPSQVDTEIDTQTQSQDFDIHDKQDDEESAAQGEVATQSTEIDETAEQANAEAKKQQAKDRAAEYRRMLELDYQEAKRSKTVRNTAAGILEDEAEEEEEEVLKGLGDFGFGVPKASENVDEDEAKLTRITEDDLKHIVDDVSDGEGDEEEAEEFRRAAVEAEEREALKRVVERVREGYDKDRTVRGAVRGKFGLNELTAAGNKAEARRLNLLTQDELESENEEGGEDKEKGQVADEEEDFEEALTKALVDRHLRRPEYDAFASESEDESEAEAGPAEGVEETEEEKAAREEEQRQKLREKLFKLRARMRRVLSKQKNVTTTIGFASEATTQLGTMSVMDEGNQSVLLAEESRTIMNLVDLTNRGTTRKSNTLYQGVIDKEQLDAGYGMGMAVSKKQKSLGTSENSAATAAAATTAPAAASHASSSSASNSGSSKGLFADVTAAAPQALKRRLTGDMPALQRQASFASVAKRQCMNRSKTTHSFSGAARGGIGQQFVFMSENSMPAPVDSNTNDASRDASLVRSASTHQRQAKPVTTIGFGAQSKPVTTIGFDLPSQSPSLLSIALAGRSKSQQQQQQQKHGRTALKPKNA